MTQSGYLSVPFFAAMNAKTEEEHAKHKAEYERRGAWYKEQKLPFCYEPDGACVDLDDGVVFSYYNDTKRGPELWPEGWEPSPLRVEKLVTFKTGYDK